MLAIATAVAIGCIGQDGTPLDSRLFQDTEARLTTMIERGIAGDADGVEETYIQILPVLREVDRLLADLPDEVIVRAELFYAVTRIERELAGRRRPETLASIAEDAHDALADVPEALGIELQE